MIYFKMPADMALAPFAPLLPRLIPFRDASFFTSTFDLPVSSCVYGLERAMRLGWYNPTTFNPNSWSFFEALEHGDMNWLIPNKLLAFASPSTTNMYHGYRVCTAEELVPVFRDLGITTVIRLNGKTYEESIFRDAGIAHVDLFFQDGTCPSEEILHSFLKIVDQPGIVALHCKAGLGRTGTLAGCYMIKRHGFTANEAISWIRLCRPGSIIGPQQHFLVKFSSSCQSMDRESQWPLKFSKKRVRRPVIPDRRAERKARRKNIKGGTENYWVNDDVGENRRDEDEMVVASYAITPRIMQPRKTLKMHSKFNSRKIVRNS
jgi:cell division cycle 14